MSEANLWDNIRDNCGHRGHFSRVEFNPTVGYPDLSFCVKTIEGHIELKFTERAPMRPTSQVFGDEGLRDAQKAWIHTRLKHGGRVFIVAQVGSMVFVIPGTEWRAFNQMTFFQLQKASVWAEVPGWDRFTSALTGPMPRYPGGLSQGLK